MTSKLTITRERLEKIKSWRETYGAGSNIMLPAAEAEELARMALAAMDSEPVAEVVSMFGDPEAFGERELKLLVGIQNMPYGTKFYRHAQPAPDNRAITQHFDTIALETAREILCDVNRRHEFLGGEVQLLSRIQCRIDAACRAAMLQELQKSAGASNNCRSNENVQVVQGESRCSTKSAPALDSLPKNTESRCGNSPVIPDGYLMVPINPTGEMQTAGGIAVKCETTALNKLWTANKVYQAMLEAAPQEVK
ncbi:TPA: hypothetical protein ROU65_001623 [Raoultella ornithinolytica]|nr:hypothetical protein [Raoultella ornithinolytica]HDX8334826.1 hypothetical protein [Raoultella ornithinolytica]